jgi:Ni,Fe-hydrogenase III small subunit
MQTALLKTYDATADPKLVVAVGALRAAAVSSKEAMPQVMYRCLDTVDVYVPVVRRVPTPYFMVFLKR